MSVSDVQNSQAARATSPQSPAVPRQSLAIGVLAVAAAIAIIASTFLPLWWVSLTAPNYPPDAFPDGIRIFFGFSGVSNGCTTAPKTSRLVKETQQEDLGWRNEKGEIEAASTGAKPEAILDCLHEMNTINHYVGMHPIGVGAPVERLAAKYLVAFLVVSLAGFVVSTRRFRVPVLGLGFAAVLGWLLIELFGMGRLDAFIAQYVDDAGKYFREPERIAQWGQNVRHATWVVALVLASVMGALVFFAWKWERFQLVLGILPVLLPFFFLNSFGMWLYFFGHNLHPWGAFTVKPFMPTVFGDGKVAQFTTHSYPLPAFGFLVAAAVLLLIAVLRRRMEFIEARSPSTVQFPLPNAGSH